MGGSNQVSIIVFAGIFILAIFALPIIREQRWYKKLLFYYFPKYLVPLTPGLKPINVYYKKLTPEERKRFEWRVYYFITSTDIEFRQFKATQLINYNAARYLIASVATQISIFLSEDCYDAFHKIIIYPDKYYSPITGQYHKGETNPGAGYIVLSWNSLNSGFANNSDGINLLMHELAHALWLENKLFDYELFEAGALENYEQTAAIELEKMAASDQHFFRRYAMANKEEFFAVAVENFFERPAEFSTTLPELYATLVNLFKQDPVKLYAPRT
jgi:Mlc titration factor MtfA (ptsG expression regulator)